MNKKSCRSEKSTIVCLTVRRPAPPDFHKYWECLSPSKPKPKSADTAADEMKGHFHFHELCSCWAATTHPDVLIPTPSPSTVRDPLLELHSYRLLIVYSINKSQLTHVSKVISNYSGSNKGDLNGYYIVINFRAISNCLSGTKRPVWNWEADSKVLPQQGLTSTILELHPRIFIHLKIINTCLQEQIRDGNLGLTGEG